MPKKWGDFLCLESFGYYGQLQSWTDVCKKLLIFMGRETLFNGKSLHTSSVLN